MKETTISHGNTDNNAIDQLVKMKETTIIHGNTDNSAIDCPTN